MFWKVVDNIENDVKNYTEAYGFGNDSELNVTLNAMIDEENKEMLLSDIDKHLPYGIMFHHTYVNGLLNVIFKELI